MEEKFSDAAGYGLSAAYCVKPNIPSCVGTPVAVDEDGTDVRFSTARFSLE